MTIHMSTVAGIAVFLVLIFALILIWYRELLKKSKNTVLQQLDKAIGGNTQSVVYDESLDSAIAERLNRLVDITRANCLRTEEEHSRIKAMISDISHQVRTPLTNMMLYAGLLEESDLSDREHTMAARIHRQAEKLEFYLKELVHASYLETDMITVCVMKNSVDDLIENACQAVELAAMKKNIAIRYECCNYNCFFDMKWSVEALSNVLDNAVKYSPQESEIYLRVINYESFVCIQVKDQGIGIAQEDQGLIFERFYRSDAVAEGQGLGIGLYLTREILQRQGGYIKVSSRLGEGAVFSLFLLKRK